MHLTAGPLRPQEGPGTSGAKFAEEAEQLYTQEAHGKLLDKFIGQLDLVLAKAGGDAGGCSTRWEHVLWRPSGAAAGKLTALAGSLPLPSRAPRKQTLSAC